MTINTFFLNKTLTVHGQRDKLNFLAELYHDFSGDL